MTTIDEYYKMTEYFAAVDQRPKNVIIREPKVLHLVLKGKWYDMIDCGEKLEEYREHKEYWVKRLTNGYETDFPIGTQYLFKPYTSVCFHRGYTSTKMEFKIDSMRLGYGCPELGAPNNRPVFIIKLGERI